MTNNRVGISRATSFICRFVFSMVEKYSGPFAEYLNKDRLKPSIFQLIAYLDGRRDGTLPLRLVRSEGSAGVRHGIR